MPYVLDRFHNEARDMKDKAAIPNGVEFELKRFYYDTAFVSSAAPMAALLKLIPPSHVVLGTDHPYNASKNTLDELAASCVPANQVAAIVRQSALPLLGTATLRA